MAVAYEYVPRGREPELAPKKETMSFSELNDNVGYWTKMFDEAETKLEAPASERKLARWTVDDAVKQFKKFRDQCEDPAILKNIEAQIDRGKQLSKDLLSWQEKWFRRAGKTLAVFAVAMGVGKTLSAHSELQDERQTVTAAQVNQDAYNNFHLNHDLSVMEDESTDTYKSATNSFHAFTSTVNNEGGSMQHALRNVLADPHKDLFETKVKFGKLINANAFNFDKYFADDIAKETGRTPEQLQFTADVLDNGFFAKPDVVFGSANYMRSPWTDYHLDSNTHASWYQEQFKQMTGFVDQQYLEVADQLSPAAQQAFKSALTDYVHSELAARVQLQRIAEMGAMDNYNHLLKSHTDWYRGGQAESLSKVLGDIVHDRAGAIQHMYGVMEKVGLATPFEAQQAQLMAEHQTLKKFHGTLVHFLEKEVQQASVLATDSPALPYLAQLETKLTVLEDSMNRLDAGEIGVRMANLE